MPELLNSQFAKLALENLTHFVPARLATVPAALMYLPEGIASLKPNLFLQDSPYANTSDHAPMHPRRCRNFFVFSGFNEPTSFIFVAKDRHFFEEQGFPQIVHAQRPRRRFGHGRFK